MIDFLKKNFKYIIFVGVLFIPFIYSFFYLKSYWDPYGNVENLPIVIVNNDKGDKGDKIVDGLLKSKSLKFYVSKEKSASDGLVNKKYYALIRIPEDFTDNLNSLKEEDKTIATITYSPNQKSNYLASQIINRAILTVEKNVRSDVSKEVTDSLKSKIEEVPDKMDDILDGTREIQNGTEKLKDSTNTLSSKYNSFNQGVNDLYNGSTGLNDGIKSVDDGVKTVNNGLENLVSGEQELNTNINNYVNGSESISNGVLALNNKFNTLINNCTYVINNSQNEAQIQQCQVVVSTLNQIVNDQNYNALVAGSNQMVSTSTYGVTSGKMLSLGSEKIINGTNELKNGVSTLSTGTTKLKDGSDKVVNGVYTLSSNSKLVNNALYELKNGTSKLNDGVNELNTTIDSKNEDAKKELKKLDNIGKYTSNPIKIKEKDRGKVKTYGVSFIPLFISIGLWVGALMCYIVFYFDQEHRFNMFDKEKRCIKQNVYFILVSLIYGLITAVLLKNLLHFETTGLLKYYSGCLLISATFMAIIQMLIRLFDDVGKFMALIVLVLQLASSGGTFPVETIDKSFKVFTHFLPMTYSINLIKENTISTDYGFITCNTFVLLMFFIVSFTITCIYDYKKTKKN